MTSGTFALAHPHAADAREFEQRLIEPTQGPKNFCDSAHVTTVASVIGSSPFRSSAQVRDITSTASAVPTRKDRA